MGGKMEAWMGDMAAVWTELRLTFPSEEFVSVWSLGQTESSLRASCSYSWLHYSTHHGLIENGGGETAGKGLEIF